MIGQKKARIDIIENLIEIYEISYTKFKKLIDKWSNKQNIDHSLFLSKNNKQYFTIDNEAGECFVEEFENKYQALCWLIRKDYGPDEIINLDITEIKKLISKENYKVISEINEMSYES